MSNPASNDCVVSGFGFLKFTIPLLMTAPVAGLRFADARKRLLGMELPTSEYEARSFNSLICSGKVSNLFI